MKKAFLTLLSASVLAGTVAEARTTFYSYDSDAVSTQIFTDTQKTSSVSATSIGELSRDPDNASDHWIETTVTFTLDLDKVAMLVPPLNTQTNLVTITENSGNKVGLTIKNDNGTMKPYIIWNTGTHNSSFTLPSTGTVTYSIVTGWLPNPATGANDAVSTFLFNAETLEGVSTQGGTGTSSAYQNTSRFVTSVEVNADYVTAFSVTNAALSYDADGIGAAATALKNAAAVPEPATATLSLLALAGLAARRRRK